MDFFVTHYYKFNLWIHSIIPQISFAIIATLLIIYGNNINRFVKKLLKRQNFIVRILIFVLVCGFGYGALTVFSSELLEDFLCSLDKKLLTPILLSALVIVGILAERKNQL